MIGKLIEIHKRDSYFVDQEHLIGTLWDISEMWEWDGHQKTPEITGYKAGNAILAEPHPIIYISNGEFGEEIVLEPNEFAIFHAVKFEILEETGE